MERILVKHLSGSKAGQVEIVSLPLEGEIVFGRDASAQIRYDPLKDDVVSRMHARLAQDSSHPSAFTLTDLSSRNGTYVNNRLITGAAPLASGDVIRLGARGPEMQFELDPRPESSAPLTRMVGKSEINPLATRESRAPVQPPFPLSGTDFNAVPKGSGTDATPALPTGVGRATVERLIAQNRSDNRKLVINLAVVISVLIVLAAGVHLYYRPQPAPPVLPPSVSVPQPPVDPAINIAKEFGQSTAYIEASWKLINTETGKQLFHRYGAFCLQEDSKGNCLKRGDRRPVYIAKGDHLEPLLDTSDRDKDGPFPAIGGSHSGSGFVVTDNGFILTNRHVAAAWETSYAWPGGEPPLPGYVVVCKDENCSEKRLTEISRSDKHANSIRQLMKWVPANTHYLGEKPVKGKLLEGRNDYLQVTFLKETVPTKATLEKVSDGADVALIKVQVPYSLKSVRLCDSEALNSGEIVTVLGYPAVSPDVVVKKRSYEPFRREGSWSFVPEPSTTVGNVQRVIKAEAESAGGSTIDYFSECGDVIQLAINTTGSGNSGGPVFNSKAEVIGIFTYGGSMGGTSISFAVPIKHGKQLMMNQPAMR